MLAIERSAQYKRHRPETTLLYQLIERYYPEFTANLAEQGKYLPKYVEREFDETALSSDFVSHATSFSCLQSSRNYMLRLADTTPISSAIV